MISAARDWKVTLESDGAVSKPDWYDVNSEELGISLEVMDWPSVLEKEGMSPLEQEEVAAHVVKDLLNRCLSAHEWAGLALDISRYAHEEDGAEAYGHTGGFCHACHAIQQATDAVVSAWTPSEDDD